MGFLLQADGTYGGRISEVRGRKRFFAKPVLSITEGLALSITEGPKNLTPLLISDFGIPCHLNNCFD